MQDGNSVEREAVEDPDMGQTIQVDHILIGILFYAVRETRRFTADRAMLHRCFFALKQEQTDALRCLRFRERGLGAESEGLDQALSNLEATNLLRRQNDEPRFYLIQPDLETAFRDFVEAELSACNIGAAALCELARSFVLRTRE